MFGENIQQDYGQPVNYLQDAMLSGQVQTAMQGKFDVNTAKIDEMIAKVSSLPLYQQDAKRYLGEKVNGLLNTVNANLKVSGGRGLLSNSATNEIMRYVGTAIDDKVKKHMKYSQDIKNFEEGVTKLKEKDPKAYNQANYEFAQYKAGLNEYIKGNVDTNLGDLSYVPYKDVMGDMTKKAKDIKDLKGDQEVEAMSPDGLTKIKKKVSGLTTEELVKYFPQMMDAQDEQQLMIDGWSEMKTMKPEQIAAQYDAFVGTKKKNYDDEIALLNSKLKDDLSPNEKAETQQMLDMYTKQVENLNENARNVDKTKPEQVGYILKKEQAVNSMAHIFAGRTSITTEIDEVAKFKLQHALDVERLELDKAKALKEGVKKNADGTYSPTAGVSIDAEAQQAVPDYKDLATQVKDAHNKDYNTVVSTSLYAYNEIATTDAQKKEFEKTMKLNGFKPNAKGDDFERDESSTAPVTSKAAAMKAAFTYAKLQDTYPQEAQTLFTADARREEMSDALAKTYKKHKPTTPARYENRLVTDRDLGGTSNTRTERVLVEGEEMDMAAVGKTLESLGIKKFIPQTNVATFEGKTYSNVLQSINQESIKGGSFNYDAPFSVKKVGEDYVVSQKVAETKTNPTGMVTATVAKGETGFARHMETYFGDAKSNQPSADVSLKDMPKNVVIKPQVTNSLLVGNDDSLSGKDRKHATISKVITNPDLVKNLTAYSSESSAKTLLTNVLKLKGVSEAEQIADLFVKDVASGRLTGNLKAGTSMWVYQMDVKGTVIGDSRAKVGSGDTVNREIMTAVQMFPAQTTLFHLESFINENLNKINTLEKAKQTLGHR